MNSVEHIWPISDHEMKKYAEILQQKHFLRVLNTAWLDITQKKELLSSMLKKVNLLITTPANFNLHNKI